MISLAGAPASFVKNKATSELNLVSGQDRLRTAHRPIPADEPSPEPNPEPDQALHVAPASISATDWDELFLAVQARLENCVNEALTLAPELELRDRHEVTKKAVLECVEAMKQLHASLTIERQAQQKA